MAAVLMRSHLGRRELVKVFDMRTYLVEDHKRIFQAIVGGDPEIADRTLREHFAIGDEFRRRQAIGGGPKADPTR
jgi:DNA-binding FadR family transcriptional regulator